MYRHLNIIFLSFTAAIFGLFRHTGSIPYSAPLFIDSVKGLKDYYADYFPIGVAVAPGNLTGGEANLIVRQFNSVTAENAMKAGPIHPEETRYFWKDADDIVTFAQKNHLKVRGHTLCWHSQNPLWLFKDSSGRTVSKELLLKRLEAHITTVVKRYKGKVYAWDVVNEAIADNSGEYLRNSIWYQICGEEYIAKAFEFAHAADPAAILFYNDYNEINAGKRDKIYKLVKGLREAGVPIHGIGLQAHWSVNEPRESQLDSTLTQFARLGLQVQITEMDVSVYNKNNSGGEKKYQNSDRQFTAEIEDQQISMYKMCFGLFRKHHKALSGVTFWNVSDKHSWLDNFPVRGRKDYPLLFDKDLQPKKCYQAVAEF